MKERPSLRSSLSAFFHALFYFVIFFVSQYMVMVSYMGRLVSNMLTAELLEHDAMIKVYELTLEKSVIILLIANLWTLLLVCGLQTVRKRSVRREFGIKLINHRRLIPLLLLGFSLNVVIAQTMSFLPLPDSLVEALNSQYDSLYGNEPIILELLSIAVVTGITEEIVFRGAVVARLKRGFGRVETVLVSSFIFGLAHGTVIAFAYSFLLGILFCVINERFKSIVPSILMHIAFNAASYLLLYLKESWIMPVYIASIVLLVLSVYLLFLRRPTFADFVSDYSGELVPRDEVEERIVAKVRALQSFECDEDGRIGGKTFNEYMDSTDKELEQLELEWNENEKHRAARKKHRSADTAQGQSQSNDNNDTNDTKET